MMNFIIYVKKMCNLKILKILRNEFLSFMFKTHTIEKTVQKALTNDLNIHGGGHIISPPWGGRGGDRVESRVYPLIPLGSPLEGGGGWIEDGVQYSI